MKDSHPILVTGAAGMIGDAVCRLLEDRGDRILAVDRLSGNGGGREVAACDVADVHSLHRIACGNSLRGIIHCGALSGPMVARDNPFAMVSVNIVGTANLLELARIHAIPRLVNCSSTSVYGNLVASEPVKEDVPLNPESVYGASKIAGEQLVATYASQFAIDGVSLRLSWVYGPRRTTECVVRTMITNAIRGVPTHLPYGGGFHRQYLYVDDAARSIVAAFDRPRLPRRTYSVTGGTNLSFDEIADTIRRIYPRATITLAPGADPDDGVQPALDTSAFKRDAGFEPSLSFEDGVRSYAGWLEAQGLPAAA